MDGEKLVGDLFLLLCKCLTTACLHVSEELLWSPSLFLGEEVRSSESNTKLTAKVRMAFAVGWLSPGQSKLCRKMFLSMKNR